MSLVLCRLLNALCCRPPLRWLLPTPGTWDSADPLSCLEGRLDAGPTFPEDIIGPGELEGCRILDAGCGMGDRTIAAGRAGARRAVGVDTDPEKLSDARALAARIGRKAEFIRASVANLPFPRDCFDLVLLLDVIEHLEDPCAVLLELERVLRPRGRILVTFPPYRSPWGAHLAEHVRIPWAHLLCPDQELLELWRSIHLRKVESGTFLTSSSRSRCIMASTTIPELWSLNRMTIERFLRLVSTTSFEVVDLRLHVPGGLGPLLGRSLRLREFVVTRVTALLEAAC